MQSQTLFIFTEYFPQYKQRFGNLAEKKLNRIILRAEAEAKLAYKKLSKPQTCSLKVYIELWVRRSVHEYITSRTLKAISPNKTNQDAYSQALQNFFYHLPLQLIPHIYKEIFDSKLEVRKKIWEKINLPTEKLEIAFIDIVKTRNQDALERGFKDELEFMWANKKIPHTEEQKFIKNLDKVLKYCNQNLPDTGKLPNNFYSVFNLPCYFCRLPEFPFKNLDGVRKFMFEQYTCLEKFKDKIIVKDSDRTDMCYEKENDTFQIRINKNFNLRHQSLFLIHELGHVVDHLNKFSNEIDPMKAGKYSGEKAVKEIEMHTLQKISTQLYQANLADILLLLRLTIFEIELYKKPEQDLSKLYAKTFNRCFNGAKQKTNPTYLINENIIANPFSSLPHAVAAVNVLKEPLLSKQRFSDLRFPDNSP